MGDLGGRGRRRDRTALLGQGTPGVGPSSPSATLTLTRAGAGLETFPIFPHFSIFCQSLNESWGPARFTVDLRRIYVAEPSRRLFPQKNVIFFLALFGAPGGAWSASGSHCPSRAGYPGSWAIAPNTTPTLTPSLSRAGDFSPFSPLFHFFFKV